MTITDQGLENNFGTNIEKALLAFLVATHPDLPEPIRLVYNTVDQDLNGDTYLASQFGFTLPEQKSGVEPKMQISIQNVDRKMTDKMRILHGKEEVSMVFTVYMKGDLVNPHYGPLYMDLRHVKWNLNVVSGTLGNFFLDQKYPYELQDNTTLPGMVPG